MGVVAAHHKRNGAARWKRRLCGTIAAYEGPGRTRESQNAYVCYTRHEDGIKSELQETALGTSLPATLAERSWLQIPGKIAHGYIDLC